MKIRLKDGTQYTAATVRKTVDHNAFFNNKLNNTVVILNVNENEGVSVEHLENTLTPENVAEVTFVREGGDIVEEYVRFARITQHIDERGNQITIVLSKDPYVATPPEGAME